MLEKKILNYELTTLIGKGGMATVYEARHVKLGTKVAVKILDPSLFFNETIKSRFENEAKAMASLLHPNIARVIDFEDNEEEIAIVMELMNGQDLTRLIEHRGRLSTSEIVSIFTQVLNAVGFAHKKGIVHRDLKPSNIFIQSDGIVKVLDFGIAKILEQSHHDLTQTGTVLGTPVYMSPEQVTGDRNLDYRSDIYSLGVALFYAARGLAPYDSNGSSLFSIQTKIVNESLPGLSSHDSLDGVIAKATKKNKDERFQSCEAMAEALLKIVDKTEGNEVSQLTSNYNEATLVDNKVTKSSVHISKPIGQKKVPKNYTVIPVVVLFILAAIFGIYYYQKNNNSSGANIGVQSADYSENSTEKCKRIFNDFHQAIVGNDLEKAISYYADEVVFYGKNVSRFEIKAEFERTLLKYTPSGTRVLSFEKAGSDDNTYEYEIDYSLYVNGTYNPEEYKHYRITGIVEFNSESKISRIRDLSTKSY